MTTNMLADTCLMLLIHPAESKQHEHPIRLLSVECLFTEQRRPDIFCLLDVRLLQAPLLSRFPNFHFIVSVNQMWVSSNSTRQIGKPKQ